MEMTDLTFALVELRCVHISVSLRSGEVQFGVSYIRLDFSSRCVPIVLMCFPCSYIGAHDLRDSPCAVAVRVRLGGAGARTWTCTLAVRDQWVAARACG